MGGKEEMAWSLLINRGIQNSGRVSYGGAKLLKLGVRWKLLDRKNISFWYDV